LIINIGTNGQELDSLENLFTKESLKPAEKIKLCDDLSWEFLSTDFNKSKFYALQGIEISRTENNLPMEGTLYRNLGVAYYMVSKLDSANLCFDKAMEIAEKTKDENLKALVNFARANLYNLNGEYNKALSLYLETLPYFEKSGNKRKVRTVLGNIGVLYSSLQNFEMAEKYYLQAEKLSIELDDQWGLSQAYNGLGIIYSSRKEYEKALDYTLRSEKIARECGDTQTEILAAQTISEVYFAHYKDFVKAESYALKALKMAEELGYPGNIAAILNSLSNICFHQEKYEDCKNYALKAIETDTTDMNVYSNMAANIVRSGVRTNDNELALKYFDIYRRVIDFRANKEYQNALMDMDVKYETEKKELKLNISEKQRKFAYAIAAFGAVFTLLILVMLFFRFRVINHRKKMAEQMVIQLEKEKQLVANQSVLVGENAERARIARDLHDGLGGMLSVVKLNLTNMKGNAFLPESDVPAFHNALEMLDGSIRELRRVAHNLMPESLLRFGLKAALTDFCRNIEHVNLHFFGDERRLEEKFEITVYRIAMELVNNALKHAEAEQINVQVIVDNDRINLVVQDNGKGFEQEVTDWNKTTGLNSINSRVESLGGKMELFSSPGKGTEVQVEFKF
jgi:signal transduction histidine kinase